MFELSDRALTSAATLRHNLPVTQAKAKKRHADLVEEIRRHDRRAYYVEGLGRNHLPTANTTGFIDELQELAEESSRTRQPPDCRASASAVRPRALSSGPASPCRCSELDKAYSEEEIRYPTKRLEEPAREKLDWIVEPGVKTTLALAPRVRYQRAANTGPRPREYTSNRRWTVSTSVSDYRPEASPLGAESRVTARRVTQHHQSQNGPSIPLRTGFDKPAGALEVRGEVLMANQPVFEASTQSSWRRARNRFRQPA